jgi:hypothetical protein
MKNLYLAAVFLIGIWETALAQPQTTITGKNSVCPDETTTYFATMNVNTFKRCYFRVTNGIILENNSTEITIYADGNFTSQNPPTITVRWNNQRGVMGKVRAIGYYDIIFIEAGDSKEKDVIIGSPEIGQFTASYIASCGEDRSAFVIDPVRGATSYQWTNTLGWSFNSGGSGTTTLFNSLTSTLSGTVSVTAINANCQSTNSTRTISVNRSPSVPFLSGPEVVQPNNNGDFLTVKGSNFNWTPPSGWQNLGAQGNYYMQIQAPPYNSAGYITVTYIDACGVGGSASKFVSTEEYLPEFTDPGNETFRVYPNPVNSDLFIESNTIPDFEVIIRNDLGELVHTSKHSASDQTIDIRKLKEGNYFLQIIKKGDIAHTQRLIVK